jgi:hypothetical protein
VPHVGGRVTVVVVEPLAVVVVVLPPVTSVPSPTSTLKGWFTAASCNAPSARLSTAPA